MLKIKFFWKIILILKFLVVLVTAKIPCDPDSFQLKDPPKYLLFDSVYTLKLLHREEIGCAIDATFRWELLKLDKNYFEKIENDVLSPMSENGEVTLDMRKYENVQSLFGKTIALRITLIPRPTHYPSYRLYILPVVQEEYHIVMRGGKSRKHYMGEGSLQLEAELFHQNGQKVEDATGYWKCHPPFASDDTVTLNFEVFEFSLVPDRIHNCTVYVFSEKANITASQIVTIVSTSKRPLLEIQCIKNCINANNSEETILQFICHMFCDGKPSWAFEPFDYNTLKQFKELDNPKNSLFIPPFTFRAGSTYKIIVNLAHSIASFQINYRLLRYPMAIICTRNCLNSGKELEFRVICPQQCFKNRFHWQIEFISSTKTKSFAKRSSRSNKLFIPPHTFFPKSIIKIGVRNLASYVTRSFALDDVEPDLKIICSPKCDNLSPTESVTLEVVCSSYCDYIEGYFWEFHPSFGKIKKWWLFASPDNSTVNVPAGTYQVVKSVNASVFPYEIGSPLSIQLDYSSTPTLYLICKSNCPEISGLKYSHSSEASLFVAYCDNCYKMEFQWFIEPNPLKEIDPEKSIKIFNNTHSIILPSSYFKKGITSAKIIVKTHLSQASYIMNFQHEILKLGITCIKNCLDPIDPDDEVILQGHCLKGCHGENIEFIWEIDINQTNVFWHDKVETTFNNKTLKVKKGIFKPGDIVYVNLFSPQSVSKEKYKIRYRQPIPAIRVVCLENCDDSVTSKRIVLKMSCYNNCYQLPRMYKPEWTMVPMPATFSWKSSVKFSKNKFILIILPNQIIGTFLFTVKVQKSVARLTLNVINPRKSFGVICSPTSCNEWQNGREKITLYLVRSFLTKFEKLVWSVHNHSRKFDWNKHAILGVGNYSVTIRPNIFQHGEQVVFQVTDGIYMEETKLWFRDEPPSFYVHCVQNCNHSDPCQYVYLEVVCEWSCRYIQSYEWNFDPPIDDFQTHVSLGIDNKTVVIKSYTFDDGDIVNASVTWSAYTVATSISFVEKAPELNIVCLSNCGYNRVVDTILKVNCLSKCSCPHIYKWYFTKGKYEISFMKNHSVALIPKETYIANEVVSIRICKGKGCALKYLTFHAPVFKLQLDCVYNCDNGKSNPAIYISLHVTCTDKCLPNMEYNWHVRPMPDSFIIKKDYNISRDTSYLLLRSNLYGNKQYVEIFATCFDVVVSYITYFELPQPLMRILCSSNCGYSNPKKDVEFNAYCFKRCYNLTHIWRIMPLPVNSSKTKSRFNFFYIYSNAYYDGASVILSLTTHDVTDVRVITFASPPPALVITCKPMCANVKPSQVLEVSVRCRPTDSCKAEHSFIWDIDTKGTKFVWNFNIVLSHNNNTISIMPYTFKNNSQVDVNVLGPRGSSSSVSLKFTEPTAKLILKCSTNCDYDPEEKVVLTFECLHCHWETINCTFNPNALRKPPYILKNKKVIITGKSYYPGTRVTVRCSMRSLFVSKTLLYRVSPKSGHCHIEPIVGISTKTNHRVECIAFGQNNTYQIYYQVKGLHFDIGFQLSRSIYEYNTDIWLGTGNPVVILYKVNLIQLYQTSLVTSYNFFGNASSHYEKQLIIESKLNDLEWLVQHQEYNKALQLSFAIERTLDNFTMKVNFHCRKHILYALLKIASHEEPLRVLTFLEILGKYRKTTLQFLALNMEVIAKACQRVNFYMSQGKYLPLELLTFKENVLESIEDIMTTFESFWDGNYSFVEERMRRRTTKATSTLHMQAFVLTLVTSFSALLSTFSISEKVQSVKSENISLGTFTIRRRKEAYFKISLRKNESFVSFGLHNLPPHVDENITIQLFVIKKRTRLFGLRSRADLVGFEVFFSGLALPEFDVIVSIYIPEKGSTKYLYSFLEEGKVQVWQVTVPINYTLELFIEGENAENTIVLVGEKKPDYQYVFNEGSALKQISKFVENYPLYIGLLGSGNLTIRLEALACLSWHKKSWKWDRSACRLTLPKADTNKDKHYAMCQCRKLSVFTVDSVPILIKPVPLQDNPFKGTTMRYSSYLTTESCLLISIFVLILIFCAAFFIDRRAQRRRKLIYLQDNNITDKEMYLIVVQTGFWIGSGTSSLISIKFFGSKGKSRVHLLNVNNKAILQRNSTDVFLMLAPTNLGKITKVFLWSNYCGDAPDWFCDCVVIKNVRTRHRDIFIVSRWFGLTYNPWTIYGSFISVSTATPVKYFTKVKECVRDYYNFTFPWTYRRIRSTFLKNIFLIITEITVIFAVSALVVAEISADADVYFKRILYSYAASMSVSISLDVIFNNIP